MVVTTVDRAAPLAVNRSKIARPVLAGAMMLRPHLDDRLDRGYGRSLTLICAPAGHGKTSTVVDWLNRRGHAAAWVSLDHRDVDLTRCATHIALALDQIVPGIAGVAFRLLSAPDRLSPLDLGEAFAEALYDIDGDLVLVLDDLHLAGSEAIMAFIRGLLRAAPRRLHLIVLTRTRPSLPVSRLKAAGELEEIMGVDLRFSVTETAILVQWETGEACTATAAASIQASVGGWPAAVRLVALSNAGDNAAPRIAVPFHRSNHLVLEYVGEEVLASLPDVHRIVLLRAALFERFSLPLLETLNVSQGDPLIGRDAFERLLHLDLFREVPALTEPWYAFHALFREILLQELERTTPAETIVQLRRSAAAWLERRGHVLEAIEVLIQAGDASAAATMVESHVNAAFGCEDWPAVASWLQAIPWDEIRTRPELLLASAWTAFLSGRSSRIVEVFNTMRDPRGRSFATEAQRVEIALVADAIVGDPVVRIANAERAIASIPRAKRYRFGLANMELAMALTEVGDLERALAHLEEFSHRDSARIDAAAIRGHFGRVLVLWQAGMLAQCARTAAEQHELATSNDLPVSAGWGAAMAGIVAHELGDLAEVDHLLAPVIANASRLHFDCVREAFIAQILAYEARGMRPESDRAIARMRELARSVETPHQVARVEAFAARVAAIRGDLVTARRWLAATPAAIQRDSLIYVDHPSLTRITLEIATGDDDALLAAGQHLEGFIQRAETTHYRLAHLEALAVRALLLEARHQVGAATASLRASLDLAAPERIVQRYAYLGERLVPILRRLTVGRTPHPHARVVLEVVEAVQRAQPGQQTGPRHVQRELPSSSLSARELEVLRCLARRLTNDEIGVELYISPVTVKHHVANISSKLAVSGRRAAAARARELGLIDA